jgi:uncharacterized protein
LLSVRLTPKSLRDEICSMERLADGRTVLKVRVRAVPESGKANEALLHLLAKMLRIPASTVLLEAGASGRVKTLCLKGNAVKMVADLERICCPALTQPPKR